MIDFVFAAEFDITSGVTLKGQHPVAPVIENSFSLASYMLPDGCHKFTKDQNVFTCNLDIEEHLRKFYFFNMAHYRKDEKLKRNSCLRAVAISSSKL